MNKPNGKMDMIDPSLIEQSQFNMVGQHEEISKMDTPKFFVKDKGGMDYVEEHYMRDILNKQFPIWNWEVLKYEFLGDAWIVVHGKLTILDNGIKRSFDSLASHRIMKKKTDGSYVDIGNDIKSANTDCFKVAVNRLCNISDDVYRKRVEDISLSEDQLSVIEIHLESVDNATKSKIKSGIENQTINSKNFDATLRKIKSIIDNKEGK
jgi:hypothetical protein